MPLTTSTAPTIGQDPEVSATPPPGADLGQILVRTVTVGIIVVTVAVTLGVMAYGFDFPSALGVGLFAGLWGGGGSGAMVGGVFHSHWAEQAAKTTAAGDAG